MLGQRLDANRPRQTQQMYPARTPTKHSTQPNTQSGQAFYRAESAQGRDLAVLAAAVYRRQHGRLRVLDVMSGCGMRGARYLKQVWDSSCWCVMCAYLYVLCLRVLGAFWLSCEADEGRREQCALTV